MRRSAGPQARRPARQQWADQSRKELTLTEKQGRRVGILLASAVAAGGLTLAAPAASAETSSAAVPAGVAVTAVDHCTPKHHGDNWKWHGRHEGRGHWDHKHWNRHHNDYWWHHHWDDKRYCKH
jgi:hypothetical protein